MVTGKSVKSENEYWHGKENSILVDLPPLSAVVFKNSK
jgi:hypothetical protein